MRKILASILITLAMLAISAQTTAPVAIPQGASFELGFSPGGTDLALVVKFISSAQKSIRMADYEFTEADIADALVAAHGRGVDVQVVSDSTAGHAKYALNSTLAQAGIPLRYDHHYAIHHHKFIIVDGVDVETGSFNYTVGAVRRNAENALVLWNVEPLAALYLREWARLWGESLP